MSPLAREIAGLIRATGPIPLDRYMALALGHPVHGYYVTRDPLGRAGDFVTAPEVSQMFGEMIGLWAAETWRLMGAPDPVRLVEFGPGRGTLAADALRAAAALPAFRAAITLHLVETSPALRARQRATLDGVDVRWHDRVEDVPAGPAILLANEFLDALPVRQFEVRRGRVHERVVGLDGDRFVIGLSPDPAPAAELPAFAAGAPEGAIIERAPEREAVVDVIARRIAGAGGAALLIDYGPRRGAPGDSFQALAGHAPVDPFAAPGTADLTSHVDFEALARVARAAGAEVFGPIGQGDFLNALGIGVRARRLAERDPGAPAALHRLVAPEAMGTLFKVLVLAAPGGPAPPPFTGEPA